MITFLVAQGVNIEPLDIVVAVLIPGDHCLFVDAWSIGIIVDIDPIQRSHVINGYSELQISITGGMPITLFVGVSEIGDGVTDTAGAAEIIAGEMYPGGVVDPEECAVIRCGNLGAEARSELVARNRFGVINPEICDIDRVLLISKEVVIPPPQGALAIPFREVDGS